MTKRTRIDSFLSTKKHRADELPALSIGVPPDYSILVPSGTGKNETCKIVDTHYSILALNLGYFRAQPLPSNSHTIQVNVSFETVQTVINSLYQQSIRITRENAKEIMILFDYWCYESRTLNDSLANYPEIFEFLPCHHSIRDLFSVRNPKVQFSPISTVLLQCDQVEKGVTLVGRNVQLFVPTQKHLIDSSLGHLWFVEKSNHHSCYIVESNEWITISNTSLSSFTFDNLLLEVTPSSFLLSKIHHSKQEYIHSCASLFELTFLFQHLHLVFFSSCCCSSIIRFNMLDFSVTSIHVDHILNFMALFCNDLFLAFRVNQNCLLDLDLNVINVKGEVTRCTGTFFFK